MASFTQLNGRWRASVKKNGIRKTKVFDRKADAQRWANATELELVIEQANPGGTITFGELLGKYSDLVSSKKRGAKWEQTRIRLLQRDRVADIMLHDLTRAHIVDWRDRRSLSVSGASVNREMTILSHALNLAVDEWGMLKASPMAGMRRLPGNPHRDRLPTQDETDRIVLAGGYAPDAPLDTVTSRVVAAYLFAMETAMRCGEICNLTFNHVHLQERFCHLPLTKNGSKRDVPLSDEALRILRQLGAGMKREGPVFRLTPSQVDAIFRKLREMACIEGLNFHDTRHAAITNLSKRLTVLELARMVGHRNISQLMVYYNAPASELADKLR